MPRTIEDLSDLDAMALTVWAEARGEGPDGQAAVAWIIRNRAEDPGRDWWGDSIKEVCLRKWQFSCWNEDDPNRTKMLALPATHGELVKIRAICQAVLDGEIPDPTNGCTHYCRPEVDPAWKRGRTPDFSVGQHDFYLIGTGG